MMAMAANGSLPGTSLPPASPPTPTSTVRRKRFRAKTKSPSLPCLLLGADGNNLLLPRRVQSLTSPPVTPTQSLESLIESMDFPRLPKHEFEVLDQLGGGHGGTVCRVRHKLSNRIMARKLIVLPTGVYQSAVDCPSVAKEIRRELHVLQTCKTRQIVDFHGASLDSEGVCFFMEFMDVGSLEGVYKRHGGIRQPYLGRVALAVLEAVIYLYQNHRIIHRDLKPSNILLNSDGEIKICDFGVSGEAINSVANTFIGTSGYMSPERIRGGKHRSQSDSWSLGITLLELGNGELPFPMGLSEFECLAYVMEEDLPGLSKAGPDPGFDDFLRKCLIKDPDVRPTPTRLMQHSFIVEARHATVDLRGWARSLLA